MSNGKMLEVVNDYIMAGKEVPDELFKSVIIQYAVDSQGERKALSDKIEQCAEAIDCLEKTDCRQAKDNKNEIDFLRRRNVVADMVTAGLIAVGTFLGIRN